MPPNGGHYKGCPPKGGHISPMYNAQLINAAITGNAKTRRICRAVAAIHAPKGIPDQVTRRIYSRRKLYNFLDALDYSHDTITAIFWAHGLSVPRDRTLKRYIRNEETRPGWLDGCALTDLESRDVTNNDELEINI